MNGQIRRVGIAMLVLFAILFLELNYIQVASANRLAHNSHNNRTAVRDFSRKRGAIVTSDGAVIAQSKPTDDQYKYQRSYPEGQLFGQVTGYFSFTFGLDGAEKQFNDDLVGRNQPFQLKHLGDLLVQRDPSQQVTLTLSKKLQKVAADSLGNRKGAVVALDPTTGAVLALWSFPSYDPSSLDGHDQAQVHAAWNGLIADTNKPLLPRSYRERYFPGSTFKVVTSSAVLDRAPELATKNYPVQSSIPLPNTKGQTLSNFGRERCGGTLPDLLRVSCNTGFAQLGLDMGADKLSAEAQAFGFDSTPPLDLPRVASSTFPQASAFARDLPGLAKSAIGQQDVQATPLQMALIAAGIANGGVIMRPHVLDNVKDSEGQVTRTYEAKPWMTATSQQTASTVRDMMLNVVKSGTGTRAQIPGVEVAGKTGTAQTGNNTVHAWFVAFAPAAQPKIAVAVIVENQPGVNESTGGTIAAPIARAVITAALGK
jgi:penicillin-binding protein A